MNSAPKKYYSVKEAANLLGVSTNTLYKYLDEGKLVSKRIGKGRFKIPYKELAPFIDSGNQAVGNNEPLNVGPTTQVEEPGSTLEDTWQPITDENTDIRTPSVIRKVEETREVRDYIPSTPLSINETESEKEGEPQEDIRSGLNDIIFFRIFKGVVFTGLGIIYLFSASLLFSFEGTFMQNSGTSFLKILPYGLLLAGILNLVEVLRPRNLSQAHLVIDAFSALVLGYLSFITVTSGEYGLFTFTAAFTAIAIGHLISGVRGEKGHLNFFTSFTRYCLYLAIIGGIIIILYPNFFPIQTVTQYIFQNRGFAAFIWFSITAVPLIYILSPLGKNSSLKLPFYALASTFTIIIATELTFIAKWDVSYITYLTGIFGFFLGWWADSQRVLDPKKLSFTILSFFWVSASLVFGLYALNAARTQIRQEAMVNMQDTLEKTVSKINNNFDERSSILTEFAGKEDIKEILGKSDQESAISLAKTIYERLNGSERVLIYNKEGVVVGVYPRNTLFQGTNFSSRRYFSETLKSYRSYISPIFEDVLGNPSVIQTEPIFENNNFIGMIGVGLSLSDLASAFQVGAASNYSIRGVDENGFLVFDSNSEKIGQKDLSLNTPVNKDRFLTVNQKAQIPTWNVYITSDLAPQIQRNSNLNVVLSLLLVLNSLFSVTAGVIAASKRKPTEYLGLQASSIMQTQVPGSTLQSPRFV